MSDTDSRAPFVGRWLRLHRFTSGGHTTSDLQYLDFSPATNGRLNFCSESWGGESLTHPIGTPGKCGNYYRISGGPNPNCDFSSSFSSGADLTVRGGVLHMGELTLWVHDSTCRCPGGCVGSESSERATARLIEDGKILVYESQLTRGGATVPLTNYFIRENASVGGPCTDDDECNSADPSSARSWCAPTRLSIGIRDWSMPELRPDVPTEGSTCVPAFCPGCATLLATYKQTHLGPFTCDASPRGYPVCHGPNSCLIAAADPACTSQCLFAKSDTTTFATQAAELQSCIDDRMARGRSNCEAQGQCCFIHTLGVRCGPDHPYGECPTIEGNEVWRCQGPCPSNEVCTVPDAGPCPGCPSDATCSSNGVCSCPNGAEVCNGSCTQTQTDPAHCGACSRACAPGASCTRGTCACPDAGMVCGGVCKSTQTDTSNCGSCGGECAEVGQNTRATCSAGVCGASCAPGFGDCDGTAGCEQSLIEAENHCGACGVTCAAASACLDSRCQAFACLGAIFAPPVLVDSGAAPGSIAVSDLNADGRPDLVVTNAGNSQSTVSVLMGNGDGGFAAKTSYPAGVWPSGVAVADFNSDGRKDLVVGNSGTSQLSLLLRTAAGGYGAPTAIAVQTDPRQVAVGDFNGDGNADLVAVCFGSSTLNVLMGQGNGQFSGPTSLSVALANFVKVADLNADGKADLVVSTAGANVTILLGTGTGTFGAQTHFPAGPAKFALELGDFNADGKLDIVAPNESTNTVSLLLGNGAGGFGAPKTFPVRSLPRAVAVADFNADGKADVLAVNFHFMGSSVSVLLGTGTGNFAPAVEHGTGPNPWPAAVGDFNADGKPDAVVGNYGSSNLTLLLNNCVP